MNIHLRLLPHLLPFCDFTMATALSGSMPVLHLLGHSSCPCRDRAEPVALGRPEWRVLGKQSGLGAFADCTSLTVLGSSESSDKSVASMATGTGMRGCLLCSGAPGSAGGVLAGHYE